MTIGQGIYRVRLAITSINRCRGQVWYYTAYLFIYILLLLPTACVCIEWRSWFEDVAKFCDDASDRIPVAFILGFYVSLVVSRFWGQLNALPWPSRMAVFVSSMIQGGGDKGRMIRRNIMRYLSIAYVLAMRDICPPVLKRFKTFQDITEAGSCAACKMLY